MITPMQCDSCGKSIQVECQEDLGMKPDAFRFRCDACNIRLDRDDARNQARIRAKHSGAMSEDCLAISFVGNKSELERQSKSAWDLARKYAESGIPKNIWIYGPSGTGKTRLALCVVNERMSFGESGAIVKGEEIQKSARLWPEKRDPFVSRYVGARNLIMDDIDQVEWTLDGIGLLREILDGRATRIMAGAQIKTLLTANCAFSSFYERVCQMSMSGTSMMDRLKPIMPLRMDGESLRGKTKTKNKQECGR